MRTLRRLLVRLAGLFRKSYREREIAEEFESHLQMHIDDNLRAGMSAAEARRQATLKFGGAESAKEAIREMSTTMWIETTLRDVQYALRGLCRNPGFAITAIVSLTRAGHRRPVSPSSRSRTACSCGPLPFREPDRIVMVWERNVRLKDVSHNPISPANYFDWKKQNDVFESMAAFGDGRAVLSVGDRVEELQNRFATADLLPMVGVQPLRGRFFAAQEDTPTAPDVLVIEDYPFVAGLVRRR